MKRFATFFALFLLISCSETPQPTTPADETPSGPDFSLTIPSHRILSWFSDSSFTRWIHPSTYQVTCPTGPCMTITTGGAYDYTCTDLPDTFYGLIEYLDGPEGHTNDTLFCRGTSCYDRKDGKYYDMTDYFRWLRNAVCDSAAASYSKIGLCMTSVPGDTVRLWNSCLDTTFFNVSSGSFCIGKLPIPLDTAQQGVFVSSRHYGDTVFLPVGYINSHDDYIHYPRP